MRNGELKPVFDTLECTFLELGIDYYMIGALARQVWYEKGNLHFRTTNDVDYAALIGSHEEYQKVKDHLIQKEGYSESKENAFVLIAPEGIQVDILPFGEIESDSTVGISGTGMTAIRLDGMIEVYRSGTEEVTLETGNLFKVATLPAIILLKFIAYDDRPEKRQKDAIDIANILINFFNLSDNYIYDFHYDLFGKEERSLESIGAIVIGREIRGIIDNNEGLLDRVVSMINGHIELSDKSDFIRLMVRETRKDVSEIVEYLNNIQWGIQNPSTVNGE